MRQFVKLVILGFFLCAAVGAICQQQATDKQSPETQPPTKRDWREEWHNATVSFGEIARDSLNQEFFHALGTGVIVNTGEHTAYLVTARHMFCDTEKSFHPSQLRVRFAWQDRKSIFAYLGIPFDLRNQTGADLWSSLEDDSDVAAIQMTTDAELPLEDRQKSYDSIALVP